MAAAIVVSALLPVLFEKLPALGFQQLGVAFGVPKKLAKLRRALLGIQSMLGDAERQIKDKAVRSWLVALKDAAYDADDILDEFNLQLQVQQQQQQQQKQKAEIGDSKASKVHGLFSPLNNNPVLFRFKMGRKLDEILERIDELVRESQEFNFTRNTPSQAFYRPPTHSYIDESTVIGREGDKESIISLLVQQHSNEESVTVLSVIGMGGLGKTTLAQLVYNDERVKAFFQPLIWVCVSEDFDVVNLVKAIIESASGKESVLSKLGQDPRGFRHLFISGKYQLDIHKALNFSQTIHTLILTQENFPFPVRCVNHHDVSKLMLLRVLDLHDTDIGGLPTSIGNLKHLGYFDLSDTKIASVPESITTLWYLQTLNLSHCKNLCKLPDGMSHMSNLRHLYLHGCPKLEQTPSCIGQLSFLQTLTKYVVGTSAGTGIGELKDLNLGGKLELYNLKYVRNPADAKEARLDCKTNLRSLLLAWGGKEW